MKACLKISNYIFYFLVVIILIAAIGTAISGHPTVLSVIRSYSMYPGITRGDLVFVSGLRANQVVQTGDIVLFRTEKGSLATQGWIIHRVVGGNEAEGYITQGDFNEQSDQENGGSVPIQREWITSKALTVAGLPLKIPLLGYVPLWAEQFQKSTYSLPAVGLALAVVLAVSELTTKKKNKRSKRAARLEAPLLYVFGGLTLSIVLAASMLTSSQNLTLVYEVSDTNKGLIMGSDVGIMQVGEVAERPLVELNNKTFLPIIATCTSRDPQISFSHDKLYLTSQDRVEATFQVEARVPGKYDSKMWVGMFFPFLPSGVIYWLARQSFWLALIVVALIPGLPIMCYPLFDTKLRRQTGREISRRWRGFKQRLPI